MKTPEEIKKGLSVCSIAETVAEDEDCKGCPYYIEGQILCGINTMLGDSLSYIDQLSTFIRELQAIERNIGKVKTQLEVW